MTIEQELSDMIENFDGVEDESSDEELNQGPVETSEKPEPDKGIAEDASPPEGAEEDSGTGEPAAEGELESEDDSEIPSPTERELELQRQIAELKEKLDTEPKEQRPEFTVEDVDFLDESGFEDISELTKEDFNKLLNKVYKSGAKKAVEQVSLSIPGIIKNNLRQHATLTSAVNEFYTKNPQLKPFSQVVANISEGLMAKNPDWTLKQLFDETEKEAKTRLKLMEKAGEVKPGVKSKPASVRPPTGRRPTGPQKMAGLEAEIDAMNQLDI